MVQPGYLRTNESDIVIALMGSTGTGKSTFINLASGSNLPVGEGLRSCTSKIETGYPFELFGRTITLVDTPGFDDTNLSDRDVLKMIAAYLSSTYEQGYTLTGVIYMHRISDPRMNGISRKTFNMFRSVCGDDSLRNVVIATTMWSDVPRDRGEAHEKELRDGKEFFAPVLKAGATMVRHDGTRESAQAILAHLLCNTPRALLIQKELVQERKDIAETTAGLELQTILAKVEQKYATELGELRAQLQQAIKDRDERVQEDIERVRRELTDTIEKLKGDRERLSREYAEEKRRADEAVREMKQRLDAALAQLDEREQECDDLKDRINRTKTQRPRLVFDIVKAFGIRRRGGKQRT